MYLRLLLSIITYFFVLTQIISIFILQMILAIQVLRFHLLELEKVIKDIDIDIKIKIKMFL